MDESGVETMEWMAILVVVAALIGVAAKVATTVKEKTVNVANGV